MWSDVKEGRGGESWQVVVADCIFFLEVFDSFEVLVSLYLVLNTGS